MATPATSVARLRATDPSPSNGSTSKAMLGRSKPDRTRSGSRRPRRVTISSATFGVAVAVQAIVGGGPSSWVIEGRGREAGGEAWAPPQTPGAPSATERGGGRRAGGVLEGGEAESPR